MASNGKLPDSWKQTTLGDISDVRRGASPRPIGNPKWFSDHGPGWVRIVDVTRSRKYLRQTEQKLSEAGAKKSVRVAPGDVIMSICATIGCPVIVDLDACIHDGFVLFDKLSASVDPEYLCAFLSQESERFARQGQKGTQGNLNTTIVKSTPFPLPPKGVQSQIVNILNSVDEAIEATRAMIDQTRRLKTALLQDLLTKGLPGRHKKFKNDRSLGRIPADWTVMRLSELSTLITSGSREWSKYVRDEGHFFVRSQNIGLGTILREDLVYVQPPNGQETERAKIQQEDLLISVTGEPGNVARADESLGEAFVSQHVALVRLKDPELSKWIELALASDSGQRQFQSKMYGQTRPGLNLDNVEELLIPLPNEDEQLKSSLLVKEVSASESRSKMQLKQLELFKSALSQGLLTGRIPVKGAE